ncbi:patatin-like phospholipase family protein [Ilumatobacter nonamiensis]|uniref:patatin-like phospholipase family protein n=1 Tax=Ilumatobacter nonamiensis TaxID=467093 RepID=UPI00034AF94D|nr:patatin-like phospholipase family protein [Ilumatobacter nonamiensis]
MSVAFVLGGGGRWGAVEVGMLGALTDAEITPGLIVGTSIGAINGAMFAGEPTRAGIDQLERAWRTLADSAALVPRRRDQLRNLVRLAPSLITHDAFEDWLEDQLPARRFEDLRIPFECVAASIERAAETWFRSGPLMPPLLASSSIPGLFPPVEVNGEHFYDGGLVNSVPISRAIELGATTLYVLQVGRVEQRLSVPKRWYEAGLVAFEISRRHRFATLHDQLPEGVTVHLLPSGNTLEPDDKRQLNWSDFSDTDALMANARAATTTYLDDLVP